MRFSFRALQVPAGVLGAALSVAGFAQASKATLAQADAALQAGEADKALALIGSLPQGGANSAEARNLKCRVQFTLQQWDSAAQECAQAVRLDDQNSGFHMWLGRALGEKAGRASFISAYSLGKQVRAEFEQAVRLDPHSPSALTDLGFFYRDAPAVMGGGLDKAEGVAAQLDRVEPARAHQLRADIAEQRKDYGAAERELKQAIAVSAHPAFQWSVLASFYQRRERWPEMEWAIHNCVTAAARDKTAGVALYDGAGVLIKTQRDPALAAKMLQDYLAGNSKTDEAPAFVAHLRLARLKQNLGDTAGAQQDQAAAFAMAHEFRPTQELRH
jgi:tetratricopeptide (TPR) repeat protein